jgi:hypothetical protein
LRLTTIICCDALRLPPAYHASLDEPEVKPPPWIQIATGSSAAGVAEESPPVLPPPPPPPRAAYRNRLLLRV